ncbi:unnamed protein product [Vitrella brassicaformis CCMP3155]|uniref:Uncharacterized protein n=1 Tax=Vitrella brassicaformis (strain CCMP3155) TaxID=1169540 RepID=A0A0G4H6T6_VITBC|nr:unnamed protein product [Vitrella brassicaformis CCMP3155]|eukprot:CEM39520.1 unnamed protein product [Vitrella brassicaformis CCMP3155]
MIPSLFIPTDIEKGCGQSGIDDMPEETEEWVKREPRGQPSGVDLRDMDALLSELGEREIESCCRLSIEDRPEKTDEWTKRDIEEGCGQYGIDDIPEVSRGETLGMEVNDKGDPLPEWAMRDIEKGSGSWLDDMPEETEEWVKRAGRRQPPKATPKATPKPPPRSTPTPAKVLPPSRRTKDHNNITYSGRLGDSACGERCPEDAHPAAPESRPALNPPPPRLRRQVQTTD